MTDQPTVVIFGLAGSGRAAAALAVESGARVIGVDRNEATPPIPGVALELGPHRLATFETAALIVVSPGIPSTVPELRAALAAGVPVVGEIHYAASFLDLPLAAITGTNGKSTTTYFAGQLLEAAGKRPFVGGNLGTPFSEAALAASRDRYACAVIEVSSYQMEWPNGAFRPSIAAILNLTPDHLARHGTMEVYGDTKCRVFDTMTPSDIAVVPKDDPFLAAIADRHGHGLRAWIGGVPGVVRDGALVGVRLPGLDATFDLSAFAVPGEHNRDNAALAALIAVRLGASTEQVQAALPGLKALPHRMQIVGDTGGVQWIDDSKATNVAAARVGVAGLPGKRGVLLLGGEAKGPGFAELAPLLSAWKVVAFGGSGEAIARELEGCGITVTRAAWLEDAVRSAAAMTVDGDVVLLSPGCASFDQFRNFEHRGDVFRELVTALR